MKMRNREELIQEVGGFVESGATWNLKDVRDSQVWEILLNIREMLVSIDGHLADVIANRASFNIRQER